MHESLPPDPPDIEDELPDFTPVPLARHRRDGWTPERQRGFIAALAESGVVASAARSVGMSAASAYKLRRRADAENFAIAWDIVEEQARARALAFVIDQFTHARRVRASIAASSSGRSTASRAAWRWRRCARPSRYGLQYAGLMAKVDE